MKRLQFKAENVTDQGIFTGHASVFGVVDLDNDVVEPGAFAESIATGTAAAGVLIFGQHDDRKEPLGRSLELREDAVGLFVKGQISDTAMGRDYTAGYILPWEATDEAPADLPADLEGLAQEMVQYIFGKLESGGSSGLKAFSISDVRWEWSDETPSSWQDIINQYKRVWLRNPPQKAPTRAWWSM